MVCSASGLSEGRSVAGASTSSFRRWRLFRNQSCPAKARPAKPAAATRNSIRFFVPMHAFPFFGCFDALHEFSQPPAPVMERDRSRKIIWLTTSFGSVLRAVNRGIFQRLMRRRKEREGVAQWHIVVVDSFLDGRVLVTNEKKQSVDGVVARAPTVWKSGVVRSRNVFSNSVCSNADAGVACCQVQPQIVAVA